MCKIKENNEEFSNRLGMGFLLLFDLYNSSNIILNCYAKKVIESIFDEYDIDLETMIHSSFKIAQEIDEQRLNTYIIDFINAYDPMLSSYLCTHVDLLIPLKNKIINIKRIG